MIATGLNYRISLLIIIDELIISEF